MIYRLASAAAQKVLTAHLSALFEEALRINEAFTGSRYLMGINLVGKLNILPELSSIAYAIKGYEQISKKFTVLYKHSLANPNYLDRLHGAGVLSPKDVERLGLTGPSSRACGVKDDLNGTHQHLIGLPVITQNEGDALARMEVRSEEIVNSCDYLINHLKFSDTWNEETTTSPDVASKTGEGYSVANSASGAVGYYVNIEEGNIRQANFFTPSYIGMHAISAALQDLVFTDFPFVFDSFGVHFTDAAR
jgi:Ni,Fe-hydrogenase III large subunit